METINVKMPEEQVEEIYRYLKKHRYPSRSEFIRDAVRRMMEPRLSEEALMDVIQSRMEVKKGEVIPIEKLL
ncbi:MAG: ribbon-helix-helix domain-containing protein [Thermoplasmatales archaeon]|nr:ribbon-helix-helix domain-containing protein [Candidatus Thermoplasmatota archaeon]MCG2825719.1 ribbon-helix-helix domain-containing protein [Thermoplasmatales archaeon]